MNRNCYNIVLLPGDGIGPEVVEAAQKVMAAAVSGAAFDIHFETHPFGGAATDQFDRPLPQSTLDACLSSDGILMGAVGGPKWDACSREKRPEFGLLSLRKALGTFANLRPVAVRASLADASPLRSEIVTGTDLLVVRELTGGIYFGEPRGRSNREAFNTLRYAEDEIDRIARVGFEQAQRRRNSVVSVDKSNVLESSILWREVVTEIHRSDFPDVDLQHMYVDNAAMQIVSNPLQFDVILTGNMFGDILSDLSGTLTGSLGMLPSACLGGHVGLFEPVHGSAPDLTGKDAANPIAAILSGAMLFEELQHPDIASRIRAATHQALDDGYRTVDVGQSLTQSVGTREMAEAITNRLINEVVS